MEDLKHKLSSKDSHLQLKKMGDGGGDRDRKRTKRWDVRYRQDYVQTDVDGAEVDRLDVYMNSLVMIPSSNLVSALDDDRINNGGRQRSEDVKNVYVEGSNQMTPEEAAAYRNYLQVKVYGNHAPNPIKTWNQTGLSTKIIETLARNYYDKPTPIQAQVLPVIMSGLDCIALTKTSCPGKILAFVLPMLAHIMNQPQLESGDGPIGLIIAPTTDLVQQIHAHITIFTNVLGLRCVPVYQGSGAAQQLERSRGAEILVCTPHPMINLFATKVTNLTRVSYVVIDEADRHLDMGFAPQVTRFVQNTRPKRHLVLFSADLTLPLKYLCSELFLNNKPVEIQQVGCCTLGVLDRDITQLVEVVRPGNERFSRLLQLLGEWYEKGSKILIFLKSRCTCDAFRRDLLEHGYPSLLLHGDKKSNLSDINICNLVIATPIHSAQGLEDFQLVINYDDVSSSYVNYVNKVSHAASNGCAVTFLSTEEGRYAPHLLKALKLSNQAVPDDLIDLADALKARVKEIATPLKPEFKRIYEEYWLDFAPPAHLLLN